MRGIAQRFGLPDGCRLGYDDYGPPDGVPLILLHGTPSSRCGWYVFGSTDLAARPGRCIVDWPADAAALADHLGIERFAVLGYSGGPYAAVCALQLSERLTALMAGTWGFAPQDTAMPVYLWHGEEDRFVPPAILHRLAEMLPDARARFYPGEGHVSLLVHHGEETLGEFATDAVARRHVPAKVGFSVAARSSHPRARRPARR